MICTGNYKYSQTGRLVSISGDCGKLANFSGETYKKLAPKLSFWKQWHDNIGIINEYHNNIFYIKEYYNQVLKNLDPKQVLKELDNAILLCYESYNEFCHRHIVAAWLEEELGILVPEVQTFSKTKIIEKPKPIWIKKEYQKIIS